MGVDETGQQDAVAAVEDLGVGVALRRTVANGPVARIVPSFERDRSVVEGLERAVGSERVAWGVGDACAEDRGHARLRA